jgi:hypothetical protein
VVFVTREACGAGCVNEARDGEECHREFCWLRRGWSFGVRVLVLGVVSISGIGGIFQRLAVEPDVDGVNGGGHR